MIAVILGILVTVSSLMLAFFLAVSNVSFIVENDFMSKAKQNAVIHALSRGQLEVRAKTLSDGDSKTVDSGYLRDFHDNTFNNLTYNINYSHGTIDVEVKVK
ncbi:MAG TPA: hypothetical protein PLJ26_07345 [Candidatus Omnitrophota bacterium]|nr:hypothetical protein [Candidatus Omnitrophota bacterium]HQJ16282.1 hypothetical protein [Candidatus Omnitrophota bacterium]